MKRPWLVLCMMLSLGAGCGSGVNSDEQARLAYSGLDASIEKAIQLGFDGFNAANSANIPPQMTVGTASGTLKVTGQVDQSASANKGMRLLEELVNYSDDAKLMYDTTANALPALNMQLRNIPNGTLDGTLAGTVNVKGEIEGAVKLEITITAMLQPGATTQVERKPGTTRITGTASSGGGTYKVDVTL